MQYNFDEIIDRQHTNALNTDGFRGYIFHAGPEKQFPFKDDEFVRMWVADMEFATPPAICDALCARIDRRIFGYTGVFDDTYYKAFSAWCQSRYGWTFPKEELTFSQGVIPALFELVEDLVGPYERVLITTPSYGYFKHAVDYSSRKLVTSDLIRTDDSFVIDFDDFERKAANPQTKLVIWCNPHNPTGRVWTEEELTRIAQIIEKYNLWIVSDEIHCDLLRNGKQHIPMGKIMKDYPKLITCMSASKTFNMAGFMFSNIIIRDPVVRAVYKKRDKTDNMINPLSLVAHTAAYTDCDEWLAQLKTYLDGNFSYLQDFLTAHLPQCNFHVPEATYLAWVDMNPYLGDVDNIPDFFANVAGVLLEGDNDLFVGNAKGFVRLNLAMPRSIIQNGLMRMVEAIQKHQKV